MSGQGSAKTPVDQSAQVPVDWSTYVDAMSAAIGITIAPEHRLGVIANLERMAQVAAVVNAVALTDTDEAAGVYRA